MKLFTILLLFAPLAWGAADCETCLDAELPLQGLLNSGISSSLQSLEDISACAVPDVGEAVRHDQLGHKENKVPNNSQFVLRRLADKAWNVEFNAKFTAADTTEAQVAEMRSRVEQCFAQASPAMTGPDGHQMRLTLRGDSGESPKPPLIAINVKTSGRGNANNFSMDFSCATVIHEFLHHAGLCDEYPEGNPTEIQNAAACRVIVREDSIMSVDMQGTYDDAVGLAKRCVLNPGSKWLNAPAGHLAAEMSPDANDIYKTLPDKSAFEKNWCTVTTFAATAQRPLLQTYGARFVDLPRGFEMDFAGRNVTATGTLPSQYRLICKCPPGNSQCQASITGVRAKMNEGYQASNRRFRCPTSSQDAGASDVGMTVGAVRDERASAGYIEFRNPPRLNRSLVHPAHFMRVLRGSCRALDRTTLYDRCAQFAYRHSQPNDTAADCSTVPAECRDPVKFLGGTPAVRP
jgi:hypothetical protein